MIEKLTFISGTGCICVRGLTRPKQITNFAFSASASNGDVGRIEFVIRSANIAHNFIHEIRGSIYTRVKYFVMSIDTSK